MSAVRVLRHLFATGWALRRVFDDATLEEVEREIAESERRHGGEICFAVEANLSAADLLQGLTPRERALQVFAELSVWDTEANNGVLIYVLWADRDVEIVADRAFNGRVADQQWARACACMEEAFRRGDARRAAVEGVRAVADLVTQHFPTPDSNELPDRPVVL
ncbi:MAG TPA: TPM domain-containing protein [Steroidobacter sp.]|jgi:uncharacterized membrane protein YgcG|nr:TPM domain-containing protein [Steroidobacteraceae bacterium]HLS79908.1 TPM domain-containing protein [Steroidobacter sp.]